MSSLLSQLIAGRTIKKIYKIFRDRCPSSKQRWMEEHKNSSGVLESANIEASPLHSSAKYRRSSWSSLDRKVYKKIVLGREILHQTTSGNSLSLSNNEVLTDKTPLPRYPNSRKCPTCSYKCPSRIVTSSDSSARAPLSARCLEVFTYIERNGVLSSALSLTKDIVSEFQRICQLEEEVADFKRVVTRSWRDFVKAVLQLSKASREHSPLCTGDASKRKSGLKHMEAWTEAAKVIYLEWEGSEQKMRSATDELNAEHSRLFGTLHRALKDGNLFNKPVCRKGQSSFGIRASWEIHQEVHTATPSSIARDQKEKEHREAVKYMEKMKARLREAQEKLDDWPQYYDEQYAEYCRAVKAGNMEATKTIFDLTLLRENQEAIEELGEIEQELERAGRVLRDVGGVGSERFGDGDGDGDGNGDGYRESMERAFMGNVDHERIDRWVERVKVEGDIGKGKEEAMGMNTSMEIVGREDACGGWDVCGGRDARSIGLSDSVSLVAQGKERNRIDMWQERCRGFGVNVGAGSGKGECDGDRKGKGVEVEYLMH